MPLAKATTPSPADSGYYTAEDLTDIALGWTGDVGADHFEVYLDTVNPPTAKIWTGAAGPATADFIAGTVHYWRVDTFDEFDNVTTGDVWSFQVRPEKASNPFPGVGTLDADRESPLTWIGHTGALEYKLYLGTSAATLTLDRTLVDRQWQTSFDSGSPVYWRIDTTWGDGLQIRTGDTWYFNTARSPGVSHKDTHVSQAKSRFIYQFRNRAKLDALAETYLDECQEIEDTLIDIGNVFNVYTATGLYLDRLGEIVGQARLDATDDDLYRSRILLRIYNNKASGTPDDLIGNVTRVFVGYSPTILITEFGTGGLVRLDVCHPTWPIDMEYLWSLLLAACPAGVKLDFIYAYTTYANCLVLSDTLSTTIGTALSDGAITALGGELTSIAS